MVVFESVKYKNFLAAGDTPITIALNQHASTLIVGKNGAGKSTMTEAISFALFGRALRNINKPALVNAVNKRETVVELQFVVDLSRYLVRRGIKPNIFEIYENGVLIPPPAAMSDYQTMLETTIVGMNFKSFMQIVVLGSASYVPFMRLTPAARRDIIEDLLDIEIFSVMNGMAKEELTTIRFDHERLQQQRTLLDEQERMAQSFTSQLTEKRDEKLAAVRRALEDVIAHITSLREQKGELETTLEDYAHATHEYDAAVTRLRDFESKQQEIEKQRKKWVKEREFYANNDVCPTCQQSITDEFKEERFALLADKEATTEKALTQCVALIEKYSSVMESRLARVKEATSIKSTLTAVEAQLPIHIRRAKELQVESTQTAEPAVVATIDIEDIRKRIADAQAQQVVVASRRSVVEAAATLLKDSGIKSRVIKHYLPIINKHINFYLAAMDFPIHFHLDAEFQEQIQSRHRDDFSYESFSEGEKKRIDVALLLTWRAIAKIKNSAACNILILDEVFDSSLDVNGTEEFLKIIHGLEDANVFVISHKTDQLVDRFANVLVFEKQRGFSALKV